jgi:hypothetical protein
VLLEAAERADLLSLGLIGVSAARRAGGGSVAHRAARAAPRSVLIVRQRAPSDAGVVVLLHTAKRIAALLDAAAGVAKANRRPLTVVVGQQRASRANLLSKAQRLLAPHRLSVHWVEPAGTQPRAPLAHALRAARGGLLVVEADHPLLHDEQLEELLDRGGCSLLLLR